MNFLKDAEMFSKMHLDKKSIQRPTVYVSQRESEIFLEFSDDLGYFLTTKMFHYYT